MPKKIENKILDNCMIKRNILYLTKDKDQLISYGDIFFANERFNDALDFYERAEATESIKKIKEKAIAWGDIFLLQRVSKLIDVSVDEWVKAADIAQSSGKEVYAAYAKEKVSQFEQGNK